ncbi:MAG TPA: MBL fold metallo-hydrolase [Chitinophagaceae bacterium]
MSLFITSLNSGSNGNCYYIGNDTEAVLIDAGISCRETEKRMKKLGLSMSVVKAIFVSHEHSDHITGIPALSKKYQLPVYITPATLKHSNIPVEKHLINGFQPGKPVSIGALAVKAFSKSHDAIDPHSFLVSYKHLKVGVFTDIGVPGKDVKKYFNQCHAAFLETNYCEDMLADGSYPAHLKRRISGDKGHLSNTQALELFISARGSQLSHLLLSHLSKNNNSPERVNKLFSKHAGSTQVIIASRYHETPVFCIDGNGRPANVKTGKTTRQGNFQLSLFQ